MPIFPVFAVVPPRDATGPAAAFRLAINPDHLRLKVGAVPTAAARPRDVFPGQFAPTAIRALGVFAWTGTTGGRLKVRSPGRAWRLNRRATPDAVCRPAR